MAHAEISRRRRSMGAEMLAIGVLLALPGQAISAEQAADPVTFAKDVAPILQKKCQVCHQPGSIGPMSLLTYEETRPWARAIKRRVTERTMPPWHIDRTVGIDEFKNDASLSDEQIDTIVGWVDAGTPLGDPNDLPPPVEWPNADVWRLAERFGEPDLIVKSAPYTVKASGQDKWWRPTVETGLTEARWVRAIEIKPSADGGRRVVHHVLATLLQDEGGGATNLASTAPTSGTVPDFPRFGGSAGLFMEWAVGKDGEIFPGDAGKLMLPGSRILWEVHYYAVGEEMPDNQVDLGVYFYPRGQEPKNRTVLKIWSTGEIDVPPGEIGVTQGFHVLEAPARLENFQPHMHMRGKAMSMEAIFPDGRRELLSYANNFQWLWHINYIYADDAAPVLPQGTVIAITAWHDNTRENPNNPDWRQWVGGGSRTVDEMAHAWVDVTYLEEDDYERLVAEREARESNDK